MAQVKLADRNTETFLTQSPSITNLILKMSLAGRRERDERLVLKVNNAQEIYEKALLACLYSGHQVRSYFILYHFSSALKSPSAIENALKEFFFFYKMSDAQPPTGLVCSWIKTMQKDLFLLNLVMTLSDNGSLHPLITSFTSDNQDPFQKNRFVQETTEPDQRREKRSR